MPGSESGNQAHGQGAEVGEVFTALADPTRRRLLDQLSAQGPMSATDLARAYPVTRQAVAKHLGALSAAGLLQSERRGREVVYDVVPGRLNAASSWLSEVGDRWDRRLDALREQLQESSEA